MESGEKDLLSKQAVLNLPRDKEFNLEGKLLAEYINVKDIEALPTVQSQSTAGQLNDSAQSTNLIDRQQAIDALDTAIEHYDGIAEECRKKANIERNDYMDMRDDAYEARQLAQWLNELKYLREKIEQLTIQPEERTVKRMETHGVCLDAISRQAAIDALHTYFRDGFEEDKWWNSTHVLAALKGVPSAQPERKKGRWVKHDTGHSIYYDCSLCGCVAPCTEVGDSFIWKLSTYCPDCGEKMGND